MPDHCRDWLAANDDVPAKLLKCPVCGNWFDSIDHLAPYHWEMCRCEYCEACQIFPMVPMDEK